MPPARARARGPSAGAPPAPAGAPAGSRRASRRCSRRRRAGRSREQAPRRRLLAYGRAMTAYVIPTIRVSSRSVLDHWVEAFGIELQTVYGEGDVVEHAQLRLGDGRLMAGTSRDEDVGKPPG